MDPQSQSFTPSFITTLASANVSSSSSSETWRLQTDVARIQQIQAEHHERISRLERRQDDNARMKSVWGNQSPFPSVLSGTPNQVPLHQPPPDRFAGFDDDANNLMSSLHLDAEDEPRSRALGATSRANSVRFDESANQNHFSHSARPSMDLFSRTSSGLGGLQMTERTSSHKSEGRASSVHSMRSAASGRANSLNLDTAAYGLGYAGRSPTETPGLAPGLMLLGPAPAIIRCWMNTNFKHDALLYAAVCSGSFKSFLDLRLIEKLGFGSHVVANDEGYRTVELPVFFPEAVCHPPLSRSSSPAPSLPSLQVEFRVIERGPAEPDNKAIQIFLGSDVLRAHNADILFSSNSMTLYDNEGNKLSIPLSRPENEAAFNSLYVTSGWTPSISHYGKPEAPTNQRPYLNGLGRDASSNASVSSAAVSPPPGRYRPPGAIGVVEAATPGAAGSDSDTRPITTPRSSLGTLNTARPEQEDTSAESGAQATPVRPANGSGSSPAIWSSWRRDGASSAVTHPPGLDWASASRNRDIPYQRKDTGIKVLKPKTASRTFSVSTSTTPTSGAPTPADGRSRFFDEGQRRSSGTDAKSTPIGTDESGVQATPASTASTSSSGAVPKTTKANPIGGATAFSWLNSGGK